MDEMSKLSFNPNFQTLLADGEALVLLRVAFTPYFERCGTVGSGSFAVLLLLQYISPGKMNYAFWQRELSALSVTNSY